MANITDIEYHKGGYAKHNLKREYINEVRTRTLVPGTNKVARGEAGAQLLRRKQEKQAYYERNRSK